MLPNTTTMVQLLLHLGCSTLSSAFTYMYQPTGRYSASTDSSLPRLGNVERPGPLTPKTRSARRLLGIEMMPSPCLRCLAVSNPLSVESASDVELPLVAVVWRTPSASNRRVCPLSRVCRWRDPALSALRFARALCSSRDEQQTAQVDVGGS